MWKITVQSGVILAISISTPAGWVIIYFANFPLPSLSAMGITNVN